MKPTFLVITLAGVASAYVHTHVARQVPDISDECAEAQEVLAAEFPAQTLLASLGNDYYKTATPTATHIALECGWLTSIPEPFYNDVAEAMDELYLWEQSPSNINLLDDVAEKCASGTDTSGPEFTEDLFPICGKEYTELVDRISAEIGWDPAFPPSYFNWEDDIYANDDDNKDADVKDADVKDDGADDTDADDADPADTSIASVGFQMSALAAFLATLLGAVALL